METSEILFIASGNRKWYNSLKIVQQFLIKSNHSMLLLRNSNSRYLFKRNKTGSLKKTHRNDHFPKRKAEELWSNYTSDYCPPIKQIWVMHKSQNFICSKRNYKISYSIWFNWYTFQEQANIIHCDGKQFYDDDRVNMNLFFGILHLDYKVSLGLFLANFLHVSG